MNLCSAFSISHVQMHFTRNKWIFFFFLWGILLRLPVTQFTICLERERCLQPDYGQTTTPWTTSPALFKYWAGSLMSHNNWFLTRTPVYSPCLRRPKSLTICWCNYKGSTFSSVILRPWVLVLPESNSRPPGVTARYTTYWATGAFANRASDMSAADWLKHTWKIIVIFHLWRYDFSQWWKSL